jgi:hypothetical protein
VTGDALIAGYPIAYPDVAKPAVPSNKVPRAAENRTHLSNVWNYFQPFKTLPV